ncbi:MAG: MFS transporter, partial [Dehalococcoidia bacterium]
MTTTGAIQRSPFRVLGHSQYRLLFIGSTLAMVAFGMMNVVQGVVAFHITGKNGAVGFVSLGQGIAMLCLGPLGGALSDRISKRRLLLFTQGAIGVMFGLIAVLIISGAVTIILLAAATLVMGCMFAVMGPARQAWIGDLLDGEELGAGVALQQLMMNATRIVGPLLAGLLIATEAFGTGGTYVVMAGIFAAVVGSLALMAPAPPRKKARATSVAADITEGLRYIAHNPDVRLLTLTFLGVVLSGFSYQTIMPGYLVNELGHPASQLGLIFGTTAAGGIVTTLILAGRRDRGDTRPLMFAFGVVLAAGLFFLALAPGFLAALGIAVVVGVGSSGFQMLNNVNLMQRADPAFFGRVMAVTMMAFGVNNIAAYPVGVTADHLGERATMALLAALCLAIVGAGFAASRMVHPGHSVPEV